jgi:hypothetical protein
LRLANFRGGVAEVLRLARAAGRVVLWIEVYNCELALEPGQSDCLAAVRRAAQVRNFAADLQHGSFAFLHEQKDSPRRHEESEIPQFDFCPSS